MIVAPQIHFNVFIAIGHGSEVLGLLQAQTDP
jgi:hypothetical protein